MSGDRSGYTLALMDVTWIRAAGRRLGALAAVLALAAALASCGEKEEPDLSTVTVPTETTPTVPTPTVPPPTPGGGTGTGATNAP